MFGLGVDNVPDDVLVFLGKYNQYWWKRRTSGFALVPNLGAEQIQCVEWQGRPNSGSYTPTNHIRYSPTVTVHEDLSVTLNNPQVLTFTPNGIGSNLQVLQGKYFYLTKQVNSVAHGNWGNIDYKTTPANVIYYASGAPTGKQNSADSEDYTYVAEAIPAKTVTGKKELHDGPWEYVRSSNRNAYPDSGIHDGYEYQFLGIPFENSVLPLRVETGSYVGTGTYGINNPCSLTLPFEPKLFIVGDTDGCKGTKGNYLYFAYIFRRYIRKNKLEIWRNNCNSIYPDEERGVHYFLVYKFYRKWKRPVKWYRNYLLLLCHRLKGGFHANHRNPAPGKWGAPQPNL